MGDHRVAKSIILALLMLSSMVAIAGPAIAQGQGQGGPPDHAGVPDDNVEVVDRGNGNGNGDGNGEGNGDFEALDLGNGDGDGNGNGNGGGGGPPDHAAAWGISASNHSDDLEATVVLDGDRIDRIELTDDRNHDGREVALNASALRDSLGGELPDRIYGEHEDEGSWSRDLTVEDGVAMFDVPHFSTNEITFSGQVSIDADPADDGARFEYEVASDQNVSDATMTMTGHDSIASNSKSWTDLSSGDEKTINIGGTVDPTVDISIEASVSGYERIWHVSNADASGQESIYVEEPEIYATSDGTSLWWVNASDGSQTELTAHGGPGGASDGIAVDESEQLVIGGYDDGIYAYDYNQNLVFDGVTADGDSLDSLAAYSGTAFIGGHSGHIRAVDLSTESVDWSNDGLAGSATVRALDIDEDNNKLIAGNNDGNLYQIDFDGNLDWDRSVSTKEISKLNVYESENYVVLGLSDGTVKAINLDDQQEIWSHSTHDNEIKGLAIDENDGSIISTSDQQVVLYDPEKNEVLKSLTADDVVGETGSGGFQRGLAIRQSNSQLYSLTADPDFNRYHTAFTIGPDKTDSLTVDYDGDEIINETTVSDGEEVSTSVSGSVGSSTIKSETADGTLNLNVSWAETTETIDPSVEISSDDGSQTIDHSGTISDGETVDLSDSIDESRIGGNVSVNVSVSDNVDGPVGQVGLNYSHSAETQKQVEYAGEAFSERYGVAKIWDNNRSDATLTIPWASDRVVELRSLEVEVDPEGGDPYTVNDPTYTHEGGELVVELEDVNAGDVTEINATGSKIRATDGNVSVLEPTDIDEQLDSKIEISDPGAEFAVEVGETLEGDRVHYVTDESWVDGDPHAVIDASGSQELRMPEANDGSSARVKFTQLQAEPDSGSIAVRANDPDSEEPEFAVEPIDGDPKTKLVWHDAESGETYELRSVTEERAIDSATANSPVEFLMSISQPQTIRIVLGESSGSGPAVSVGGTDGGSSGVGSILALFAGVGVSLIGFVVVGRRVLGARGASDNSILLIGGTVVGLIGVEAVTSESIIGSIVSGTVGGVSGIISALLEGIGAFAGSILAAFASSGFAAVILSIAVLVGLWIVDQRTDADLPWWTWVVAIASTVFWFAETVAPGALTGGLEEISSLIWIAALGIVILWIWRRSQPRPIQINGGDE